MSIAISLNQSKELSPKESEEEDLRRYYSFTYFHSELSRKTQNGLKVSKKEMDMLKKKLTAEWKKKQYIVCEKPVELFPFMSTITALLLGMMIIFGAVCAIAGRVEIFSISIILVISFLFTFLVSLSNDEYQHGLQRDHSGLLGILNSVSKNTKPYLFCTVFSIVLLGFCSKHIIEPYQSICGAMGLILLLFSQIFLVHTAYKSSRRAID
ncbi:hypothetical protein CRE_20958 [Caenorhabditis remanei]|uniref:Uncharacterized protein n=1 Tax=Caenorhabditis remanei TaxID=31234 RepID=E3NCR9_CAERE|nr:hypothetical protein CRE_20958 [Caenorhabditis remanei]